MKRTPTSELPPMTTIHSWDKRSQPFSRKQWGGRKASKVIFPFIHFTEPLEKSQWSVNWIEAVCFLPVYFQCAS